MVTVASLACVGLLVFLPLLVIHVYVDQDSPVSGSRSRETAVGIGVVLRSTIRRWARFGSRKLLRTTIAAYSRASSRAFTRRIVKTASRVVIGSMLKGRVHSPALDVISGEPTIGSHRVGLALGVTALSLSFWGVLLAQSPDDLTQITSAGSLTLTGAALIAGLPLIVYAIALRLAARLAGGTIRFQTALDGLLLQAYFTGAGSFLPLTTDVHYAGDRSKHHLIAASGLVSMYVVHLLLLLAGNLTDIYALQFASAMFLTYCFVFSFPIYPLDGYYLWARSRWLWFACWVPIMASFVFALPPSFAVLL